MNITNHEIKLSASREDFYNITQQVNQAISANLIRHETESFMYRPWEFNGKPFIIQCQTEVDW